MRRCLSLTLLFALLAAPAWAGTFDIFGTGARSIALGGAYAAIGDDLSGLYYNNAAITQVERVYLNADYTYFQPQMIINGRAQNIDESCGTTVGGIISTKVFNHRLSLGTLFYMPDQHLMRFLVLSDNQPHQAFTCNANHTFTSVSGAGFEVFSWMSVGVGVSILATEVGGVDFAITEKKPSEGSEFSNFSPSYAIMAGLLFKPTSYLRIGASFRDKVEMTLELPNKIDIPPLTIYKDNNLAILRESHIDLMATTNSHFSPRNFELGVAGEPWPWLLLAVDVAYAQWSDMRRDSPFAGVYVSGGLADVFPTKPGPVPPEPGFHDIVIPAFGVEGRPVLSEHLDVAVRGGYRYRPTPVPEQTGLNNYLDADTHVMSAGVGVTGKDLASFLPPRMSFDAFGQYQYSPERVYDKSSPGDVIGDIRFQQRWWGMGGSLTVRF
jgi:long-chain fatty acid transport protein